MKKILLVALTACLFTACKNNSAPNNENSTAVSSENTTTSDVKPNGRFDDKSGILVTETDMMGMGKMQMIMTFDNYGKDVFNETKMSMMGKEMHTKSLVKDGYAYTWTEPASMAVKAKIEEGKVDDKNIDYNHLSEEMKKKLNMKEEANETVDGKDCKVFSFSMKEGMSGKSWIWKGLPVQTEMNMSGKKIMTKFVRYETNVSIPSSTFDVPSGVDFKEMNIGKTTAEK